MDNLERAIGAAAVSDLHQGVRMIYEEILETLKRHGFEPLNYLGEPFDGRFHAGIAIGCKPEWPDLAVIEFVERGWIRGAEMFRPAKVLLNKLPREPPAR